MASHKKVGSLSGFWDLFTKLHRSSWMSDVFAISSKVFSKMWLASQVGPGLKNPIPKVNLLCGKFCRVHYSCLCLPCRKVYLIDETPFPNLVFSMLPQTQSC